MPMPITVVSLCTCKKVYGFSDYLSATSYRGVLHLIWPLWTVR